MLRILIRMDPKPITYRRVLTLRNKQYAEQQLSVVKYSGESIFYYKYLSEYDAKIENIRYRILPNFAHFFEF